MLYLKSWLAQSCLAIAIAATCSLAWVPHAQAVEALPTSMDEDFPQTVGRDGVMLQLNGRGTRNAHVLGFKIRVFDGALYLEKPVHDGDGIIQAAGLKLFRFKFLREVPAWRVREAWQEGYEEYKKSHEQLDAEKAEHAQVQVQPASTSPEATKVVGKPKPTAAAVDSEKKETHYWLSEDVLKSFIDSLPDYASGESQEFLLGPNKLEIWNKGTLTKKIDGEALPHFFLEVWFHHSPDEPLTKAWIAGDPAPASVPVPTPVAPAINSSPKN